MYRLTPNTNKVLEQYFKKYAPFIKDSFEKYLDGSLYVLKEYGTKHKCNVKVKVEQDFTIPSFTRDFLTKYKEDAHLYHLLCGDVAVLDKIMNDILQDSILHFQKLSKSKPSLKKINKGKSGTFVIDDFNTIMHDIFVDKMFDANGVMNKDKFIQDLDLRVCPYCGDTYIYKSTKEKEGKTSVVKPQLDHFLPKVYYPFFAMSFHNLIPSCQPCNLSPNKATGDPKGEDKKHIYLMQPYEFDVDSFCFDYKYDGVALYNDDSFQISIDYKGNTDLSYGFNAIMTTQSKYEGHNAEAGDLWRGLQKSVKTARHFLAVASGIPEDFWDDEAEKIVGYTLHSPNDSQRALYKFNKDIFEKMLVDVEKKVASKAL